MGRIYEGKLVANGLKFGLVVSRFNELITRRLLSGALDLLERHGAAEANLEVFWVPGALEIPLVAKRLAASGRYNAILCLGAIIRGASPHFEYVAAETAKGIAEAGLSTGVPAIYGIVTADTIEQALERAGTKLGNRGADAARSAIEMADLLRQLPTSKKS